jgi:hypothetical protein
MAKFTIFKNSVPNIGLYTRQAIPGEELTLVEQFIEYYCHKFKSYNHKTRLAVFIEPRIESGFPDVVFASYLPSITDNWSDKREELGVHDLKLLSYFCVAKKTAVAELISKLGYPEKLAIKSLERLLDAKLITYKDHSWRIRELRKVFSVTKLLAVEAKLKSINKVVEQTHRNTWFASHSYALINVTNPQGKTLKTFTRFGLGLYCKSKQFQHVVEAREYSLPSSYLSFQFNEWIGKNIARQG